MKIRNMIGFVALGGALYAHRRHGGEWTIESFQHSLQDLWNGINRQAVRSAEVAKGTMREFAADVSQTVDTASAKVDDAVKRTRPAP